MIDAASALKSSVGAGRPPELIPVISPKARLALLVREAECR
jgi:hypothetical protein